jgi:hypothetical protein
VAQAKAAIKLLTLGKDEEPWHRDGWIFQTISWIAASQAPSGSLTCAPHIRRADKGFDGLQLQLSEDGKVVTAVIVFEDKGAFGGEHPIDAGACCIALALPGGDFGNEPLALGDAPVEALAAQHAEFDLNHVEPAGVFGDILELQPA